MIALPGSLRDLLAVGLTVWQDDPGLHREFDPDVWIPAGGHVHTVSADEVGVVLQGVKGRPSGLRFGTIPIDRIHDCGENWCLHRPAPARPADIRYVIARCHTLISETRDRTERLRLDAVAMALLTKALV